MRRLAAILLMVAALLLVPAAPSQAQRGHGGGYSGEHGGGPGGWRGGGPGGWRGGGPGGWRGGGHGGWYGGWRGGVFLGSPWWWGGLYPYPYWGYPQSYWDYPQSYYGYPPVGVEEGPSMYIQQEPAPSAAPSQAYWYYCASAKAYYPKVQKCPEAWIKVPPPQ
jgi:hypothetical protein